MTLAREVLRLRAVHERGVGTRACHAGLLEVSCTLDAGRVLELHCRQGQEVRGLHTAHELCVQSRGPDPGEGPGLGAGGTGRQGSEEKRLAPE